MRGRLLRCVLAAAVICAALPLQCFASETTRAGHDGISLEMGDRNVANVTLDMPGNKGSGMTALRLSFHISPAVPGVTFDFSGGNGSAGGEMVTAYRYHDDTGTLNVYAAGEQGLFKDAAADEDLSWKIGQVRIPEGMHADVTVDTESSDLVYGDVSSSLEEAGVPVTYPDGENAAASGAGKTGSAVSSADKAGTGASEGAKTEADTAGDADAPVSSAAGVQKTDPGKDTGGAVKSGGEQSAVRDGSAPVLRWIAFIAVCAVGVIAVLIVISQSRKKGERRF